jgi:hypothetical protein
VKSQEIQRGHLFVAFSNREQLFRAGWTDPNTTTIIGFNHPLAIFALLTFAGLLFIGIQIMFQSPVRDSCPSNRLELFLVKSLV